MFSLAEKQQKEVWSSRLQKWLYERFGVYMEDFRFQPEESTVEAEEPLSAKRWVRCSPEQNITPQVVEEDVESERLASIKASVSVDETEACTLTL